MRILIVAIALLGALSASADTGQEIFSIYLVRHAEKGHAESDPKLTDCGAKRAASLARFLRSAPLQAIYSSDYRRTRQTAEPVAVIKQLSTELYDPQNLPAMAKNLLIRRQNALVVGHSNTTSVLAGLLNGNSLLPFNEQVYDRIYQVTVAGTGSNQVTELVLLHQVFECKA